MKHLGSQIASPSDTFKGKAVVTKCEMLGMLFPLNGTVSTKRNSFHRRAGGSMTRATARPWRKCHPMTRGRGSWTLSTRPYLTISSGTPTAITTRASRTTAAPACSSCWTTPRGESSGPGRPPTLDCAVFHYSVFSKHIQWKQTNKALIIFLFFVSLQNWSISKKSKVALYLYFIITDFILWSLIHIMYLSFFYLQRMCYVPSNNNSFFKIKLWGSLWVLLMHN